MSKTLPLGDDLLDYTARHSLPPDEVVDDLVAETRSLEEAVMQITPIQGPLLHLLVRLLGASRVLEIGTFTGLSSIWMARALPEGGSLLCCDISEEWTATARRYWRRAGVEDRIELRLGPAGKTLRSLPPSPSFDLAFLDADKEGYPSYLDEIVPRIRPGGLLVADNVLRGGRVVDPGDRSPDVEALRRFNAEVAGRDDLEAVVLPLADGMTLARKAS